jgi:transcriptional regulator with XRE-family HTH domain
MAETTFGTHLRELRVARGLSLNRLARQAGIGAATLSRWESGAAQPRLPELEAALSALGATTAQKRKALARLDAPRALRRLRQEMKQSAERNPLLPPSAGGLLRALRLRRGLTQARAAAQTGVAQSTLARWERGDLWPSTTDLHRLCFALGAREAELIALTCCPETLAPPLDDAPLSLEEARAWIQRIIGQEQDREPSELVELHFWQMTARLWPLYTAWGEDGRIFLAEAYARHAQWLIGTDFGVERPPAVPRRVEALHHCEQSLAVLQRTSPPTLMATLTQARLAVYPASNVRPETGIALLRGWAGYRLVPSDAWTEEGLPPEFAAWLLRDLAEYMALQGRTEEALRLSQKSSQIASLSSNTAEKRLRDTDRAEQLLRAGKPGEALETLPPLTSSESFRAASWQALLRAEALFQTGQRQEAQADLQRALTLIEHHDLNHLRDRAGRLARLF